MTLHRRWSDVVLKSCACWVISWQCFDYSFTVLFHWWSVGPFAGRTRSVIELFWYHHHTWFFFNPQREKRIRWHMRSTRTQISLRTRPVVVHMEELCILGCPKCVQRIFWTDCARLRRLIWIFVGRVRMSVSDVAAFVFLEATCYYQARFIPKNFST